MDNRAKSFLLETFPTDSYFCILQRFLRKQNNRGLSTHTINRLYYSLHPIGITSKNPAIKTITKQWLKEYIRSLWERYASESIRTYVGDIKLFFTWCKKKGHHPKNIAKRIKKPRRRQQPDKLYAAPEKDIQLLLTHLSLPLKTAVYRDIFGILNLNKNQWPNKNNQQLRDLLIITFLYETGARVGELATLNRQAMNRATSQRSQTYAIIMYGKTGDVTRRFTQRTAELWHLWEQIRPSTQSKSAIIGWSNGRSPKTITPNGITQMIYRRCQLAEIRPFRANALRHSKITRSRKIIGLEAASKLIEHTDIRTTKTYNHWEEDELKKAAHLTGLKRDLWREL